MAGPRVMAGMAGRVPSVIMDGDSEDESGVGRASTEDGDHPADDAALVRDAQAGDRAALEALIRRHQRTVFRLCLRYVRDRDEAADLVQRTFVRTMGSLPVLRAAESFRAWILRIAANLALNHLRDAARFVRDAGAGEAPGRLGSGGTGRGSSPDAGEALEAGEATEALRRAVQELPPKQRMTLELRVHEELSFRDIGEALGTSEGAAKVNFHHAVRKLKDRLRPVAGGPTPHERSGH